MNIRIKLLVPIVIGFALFMGVIQWYWAPKLFDYARSDFNKRIQLEIASIESDVIRHLISGDYAALFSSLDYQQELHRNNWAHLTLTDSENKQKYPYPYPISNISILEESHPNHIGITYPLVNEDIIVGYISLHIDWTEQFEFTQKRVLELKRFLAAMMLLTLFLNFFSQYISIQKPLLKLKMATLELANGNFDIKLPKPSRDEIGQLTHNFELMRKNILNVQKFIVASKDEAIKLANEATFEKVNIGLELTQLIDTANAPIFGIDAAGLVNEWNQRAALLTGFGKADVMGKDLVARFITDDYKASVKQVLDKALKGEESANFEFPLFDKSGDRVDVLLNSTSRRDSNGKIVGVIGVGQDITELKFTQAQVIQSSKLATLGEMATSVAHELNQPLTVIRMAAGNSRRKISKGTADSEYLNDKLERIENQTARAAAIIDHMRMFGRKAEEKPRPIDLRQVVTNALDLMGEQLRLAGIEIVTEFPEDCSSVSGHTIQLEQVILNLLTNAWGAIAESESESEKKIALRVFEDENGIHVTSLDTGGGIPDEVLPRIFEPFYTTKEMGKGTGLGLSVSYGIIRDMNGTIIAENIEDGARFTITLPAAT
jgi:PAS domain S-box-containing protein